VSVALQRRQARKEADEALSRLQEMAREQAERIAPYAAQAKEAAALRLQQARGWTAPRLQTAAQRVEDTVAPRVAELLNTAAQKVDPTPPATSRRKLPRALVYVGIGAVGLAAVYGVLRLRRAAQDAEWQANLESAREQVRHTREQLAAKARQARERLRSGATASAEGASPDAAPEGSVELNGRVTQ